LLEISDEYNEIIFHSYLSILIDSPRVELCEETHLPEARILLAVMLVVSYCGRIFPPQIRAKELIK
jgi:hypothetical protein